MFLWVGKILADISALSRTLDSADIYISCSVHKCEWHSSTNKQIYDDCDDADDDDDYFRLKRRSCVYPGSNKTKSFIDDDDVD